MNILADPGYFPPGWIAAAVALLWAAGAWGTGSLILRRGAFIERFAVGVAGFALVGGLAPRLALTLPHWFFPLAAGLAAVAAAVTRRHDKWRIENILICVVLTALGLLMLGSALLPPAFWDEQIYQAALCRHALETKTAAVWLDNPYSAYPSLNFFALAGFLRAGGLCLPRLAVLTLTLVLAGSVYQMCRRWSGAAVSTLLTFTALLSPVALAVGRESYAESYVALFFLAGLSTLYRRRKQPLAAALTGGIFAGAALAVKLTACGAALALFIVAARDRQSRRRLIWFAAGAGLIAFPFYWRVFQATGDFIYPFGALLGFGDSAAAVVADFHRALAAEYGLGILPGLAVSWLTAAWDGRAFDGLSTGLGSLALLALTAWGVWTASHTGRIRREKAALPLAAAGLAFYIFWGFTAQQTRFLYPLLLLLAPAAARGVAAIQPRLRFWAALFALLAALATLPGGAALHYVNAWRWIPAARKFPAEAVAAHSRDPGFVAALRQLDNLVAKNPAARVLLFMERRTLYAPRNCRIWSPLFNEFSAKTPTDATELEMLLGKFDFVLAGSGRTDVDARPDEAKRRDKLIALLGELLAAKRFTVIPTATPDYIILRPSGGAAAAGAAAPTNSIN